MNRKAILEGIKKERRKCVFPRIKVLLGFGICLGLLFSIALFVVSGFSIYSFFEKLLYSLILVALGVIGVSIRFINVFIEVLPYYSGKFNVEIARVEDKRKNRFDSLQDKDKPYYMHMYYSLKVNGDYYECTDNTYMRANVGQYYTIVYSGRKKRRLSKILCILDA